MALVGFSHMKFILTLSFSARNPTCNPTWSITHIAFIYIMSHSTKAHLSPLSQVSSLLPFDSKSLGLAPPPNLRSQAGS